ncbi:MAG: hypothetical protein ACREUE_12515 [Panacagrimonas sp.]
MKTVRLWVIAAFVLTGCASIQGTTQDVKVDSTPQGATVYVGVRSKKTGGAIAKKVRAGVTPATVNIPRKDGVILLEKAGYAPAEVPLKTKLNPWFWGDVALLSLLSTSIDTSTGAINKYDPDQFVIPLQPTQPTPPSPSTP